MRDYDFFPQLRQGSLSLDGGRDTSLSLSVSEHIKGICQKQIDRNFALTVYLHSFLSCAIKNASCNVFATMEFLYYYWEPRITYCAGISCTSEPRFALAKLRFSAQHLLRSLRLFEVPYCELCRLRQKDVRTFRANLLGMQ